MQFTIFESFCGYIFVFITLCIFLLDLLFLTKYGLDVAAKLYRLQVKRSTAVAGAALVLYAATTAALASTLIAQSANDAATVGAALGFLVFWVYNLTTFVINDQHKISSVLIDCAYGTLSWAGTFALAHVIRRGLCE